MAALAAEALLPATRRLPAKLLPATLHEDSLRLAILSTGDGRAGCAGGRVVAALGCGRTRRNRAHGISQSSDRRTATRVSWQIPPPGRTRANQRRQCSSHLAASFSQPQGARAHVELQFVLRLGGKYRSFPVAARRRDCYIPTVARRTLRVVVGPLEACPLRFRSARSLARVAGCGRHGRKRFAAPPFIGEDSSLLIP